MKKGLNNILREKQFGMPALHMQAIERVAKQYNVVIGIRPVNKYALSLLQAGCPTKPFAVKNRSIKKRASVLAGFIAISPEYSQIDENQFQIHSNQLKTAFANDKDLRMIACEISASRITELKLFFGDTIHIQFSPLKNEYTLSWKRQEKTITVTAKKNSGNDDYTVYDTENKPLQVLGKEIVNARGERMVKPVTADYDLLMICPAYNDLDLSGKDKALKSGNVNERTREVLNAINREIASMDVNRRGINLETVHHNTEFNNPFPVDRKDDLPCLIMFPHETMIMIENSEELRDVFAIVHQENYYWSPHAKYPELRIPTHVEQSF